MQVVLKIALHFQQFVRAKQEQGAWNKTPSPIHPQLEDNLEEVEVGGEEGDHHLSNQTQLNS